MPAEQGPGSRGRAPSGCPGCPQGSGCRHLCCDRRRAAPKPPKSPVRAAPGLGQPRGTRGAQLLQAKPCSPIPAEPGARGLSAARPPAGREKRSGQVLCPWQWSYSGTGTHFIATEPIQFRKSNALLQGGLAGRSERAAELHSRLPGTFFCRSLQTPGPAPPGH